MLGQERVTLGLCVSFVVRCGDSQAKFTNPWSVEYRQKPIEYPIQFHGAHICPSFFKTPTYTPGPFQRCVHIRVLGIFWGGPVPWRKPLIKQDSALGDELRDTQTQL
jgi:hypothetical protein